MNPRPFEYHAPTTLKEAVSLLKRYRGEAKLLAGGQSLVPLMKLRIAAPAHLIDLNRVGSLAYIKKEDGHIAIGPLTRMADLEASQDLRRWCPIIPECATTIADPLVRNLGTIGGNVSHADPANDMPAVMVATGAELVAAGPGGTRGIAAEEFFLDTFTTALKEDELLAELRIPVARYADGAYAKLERQAGDFGIVGVAASVRLSGDGKCAGCGIGLTGAGPTVVKARKAEVALVGSKGDPGTVERASALASEESSPVADLRGSEEYKREMVKVMTKRALSSAVKRARSRLP
ncbi:MAG TPA: xanthine dehydrogenase family protein subunit M [Nitrososphaerales archaeon]|nr:xanthine dehydrogenase family protein subunit M [Nitrososphaerales archaeon]